MTPAWAIRTYERGIEAETLACGTGTVAGALALAAAGLAQLPLPVLSASGKVLSVTARLDGMTGREVWLCGEGRPSWRAACGSKRLPASRPDPGKRPVGRPSRLRRPNSKPCRR